MKIAVLAYGSRGDVQPVLAIADALHARGHAVRMTVNVSSARWAAASGLTLVPMQPDVEQFWKSRGGRELLASGKTLKFLSELSQLERDHNEELSRGCIEACEGAELILSTLGTVYRAHALEETTGALHLGLLMMPTLQTGSFASYLTPVRDFRIAALNRWSWDLQHAVYWLGQKAMFNDMRRALGLAEWTSRPRLERRSALGLFSEHLVGRTPDAPPTYLQVGQPTLSAELRRRLGEGELPEGLEAWLAAGPPPVFFGFGSMPVLDPKALMRDLEHVCRQHSIRALVGAGWSELAAGELPESIFLAESFNHDAVLPRCVAAVHHGGVGTTHSALRAGLPSLICSLCVDQPFWGHRVAKLGVGCTLRYQDLSRERLSAALQELLQPGVAERAQQLGRALKEDNATERAADTIERFVDARGIYGR